MIHLLFKYFTFFIDACLLGMGLFVLIFGTNDGFAKPFGIIVIVASILMVLYDIKYVKDNKTE